MESIVPIKGKVKFVITLDSGVWIFDDRKIDLSTFFDEGSIIKDELEEYTKAVSKHWSREIQEGATYPPTLKTEKKYEKEKVLTGSFAIPFSPFLKNAEPLESASKIVVETETGEYSYGLHEANDWLLGFSKDGKPLKEDGPIHIIFKDGSNKEDPIKHVKAFRLE
ncbi:peptidyl-prolyl cis-trans isomerase [Rossellomorea aquimaris]|uniref:peptidyl-prolyl cis-trans isomerase n=1 Tax=Rossellomorea aquimaris TaxID=189382 RepID=UPI001CD3DDEB|nr:peptidyl-prolyl cis-trans isomerase [Rossellomorea aquimaris]MCA1053370.1 peptidyl-prolyl cis-trans isomerase [Rossellomorea aquimaris]